MRFLSVLCVVVSTVFAVTMRPTPHGMRPVECVLEVTSGSRISEENGHVRITAPAELGGAVTYYKAPDICHTYLPKALGGVSNVDEVVPIVGPTPEFPPLNGWLDYAGWYPGKPDNSIQSMSATYTVPNPPATNSQQTLYYFIGIQDNSSPNVNILQPVLTFGPPNTGWYVESWACCPTNISVHSNAVLGLKPGTTMTGLVQRQNADVWEINSSYNGKNTTLFPDIGGYNYNWFAATEEIYGVGACNEFAHGPMTISKMVLLDKQGGKLNPKWQLTGATNCGGSIKLVNNSPFAVVIQHTQSQDTTDRN
jgi:hypothetical protein